ncbi:MAG TPA: helix-turn-helix domain-containing protein [Draconibacterium sp.]|nr:helix-turn-helix domain-containing protein [Draconibacterium sp.]
MKEAVSTFDWRKEIERSNADSIGEDYILFDEPRIFSSFNVPFKIDVTTAIICTQGTIKGMVNMNHYHVTAPFLFIIMADQVLQYESFSDDFSGHFIVMSNRFLENLFMNQQYSAGLFLSVKENPFIQLNDEDLQRMITYYGMFKNAVRMKDNPYRMEMVKHLNQTFFYGTSYQFHKIPEKEMKTKNEVLVKKFLEIVGIHFKEKRQMEFYAQKLFLTPKYLSKIIKETSGKSGNEWIDSYVILEAKALLNSTNMTIQQISDWLNFPTQSFFGRYFKRHVGLSPKQYRTK